MCLDCDLSKKQSDKIIQQAKKTGYIRVYKICGYIHDVRKRTGNVFGIPYKQGVRKANNLKFSRNVGWYVFLSYNAAKKYRSYGAIKVCYAKPQWVKRLGRYDAGKAGVFTHLAFPNWERGDMTIREFRQMCKEYKGK